MKMLSMSLRTSNLRTYLHTKSKSDRVQDPLQADSSALKLFVGLQQLVAVDSVALLEFFTPVVL